MKLLITGGTGYIGSHTCVELLNDNHEVIILDNLSNSEKNVVDKIKQITHKDVKFYQGNMMDKEILNQIFDENKIDAVIDFAAYKAVGESVEKPIEYYTNNVSSVLCLLDVMRDHGCKNLIFSSSATVYGDPDIIPINEECKTGGTTNPYGTSKLFVEQILKDLYNSDNNWNIVILRYFNPIGAHESGLIGERPNGVPANLMPYISQVASGKREKLFIYGNDYDTKDGTGVRDYIHVVDLAIGHVKALKKILDNSGLSIYNLGTGIGYSVLDIVKAFEKANNIKINYEIADRRKGDIATCYSDPSKAYEELGFKASKTLEDMCKDAWNYEKNRD